MASAGFSRQWTVRHGLSLALAASAALSLPTAAQARTFSFNIAAGPLDTAILAIARQSGVDVASAEPGLHGVQGNAVSGRMSVKAALRRLMAGTGYEAIAVGTSSFRVARSRVVAPRSRALEVAPPAPVPVAQMQDIIVTGTKQRVGLLRYPGSIQFVGWPFLPGGASRSASIDDVAREAPVLQKTELGKGRNKLFIRGVSDSSFNGSSQATATVYFGDVPMGYAGPQPALNLYDIERVEILEGPQGTLYGAGAIGGVVRVTPNEVNLSRVEGSIASGVTATQSAEEGYDLAGMINLPIKSDMIAVRLVGYHEHNGGYIDDSYRALDDINHSDTVGGRIAILAKPGDGWTVELGSLIQQIDTADGSYALISSPPLTRRSFLAQPFSSRVALGNIVLRKTWESGLQMVSATGLVDRRTDDVFDLTFATGSPVPIAYQVSNAGRLVSHETHISRSSANGTSFVLGFSLLYNRDGQDRAVGQLANPTEVIGVTNITRNGAIFGEMTRPLTDRLAITGGLRATIARTDGEPSTKPAQEPLQRGRETRRVEPTIALSWLLAPRLAAFARFQSGYRTGGIAVARGIGRVNDFLPDAIIVGEVGLRKERSADRGLAFSTSLSFARWHSIQADLFSVRGQPYTDNIGDADIAALEAIGDWVAMRGLRLSFAALYTASRTRGVLAASSVDPNRRLPETPSFASSMGIDYQWKAGAKQLFRASLSGRYVGRSVLGTGSFFDISQGRYVNVDAGLNWHRAPLGISLAAANIFNVKGNLFALGNPETYAFRDQAVPLRPRNIRLGFSLNW